MGESSACLVRSFSNPPPTSTEEIKGNPLTSSISLGRFVSESLDWEKWSVFTQNRYLEEAERYSKPGSVAEKKAYFEAHFKRRRAAALLEQQNAEAANLAVTNTQRDSDDINNVDASAKRITLDDVKQPKQDMEPLVELTNHVENDGCFSDIVSKIEDKEGKKDNTSEINSLAWEWAPVQLKNSEKTPESKSKSEESSNKRRSYTTSLHTSINFASEKDTSKSRIVRRAPAKKFKNSSSTTESATGLLNSSRITRPISRATKVVEKVQPPSSNYSKSSVIKIRTPTMPSSFTFKSEERAVKRREKLEQKMKSKDAEEKHQIHAKPQTKARSSDKAYLRNSVATKNAEFPPRNLSNKAPTRLPKIEEKPVPFKVVQDKDTRPPWRLSVKNQRSNAPSYSSKCFTTKKCMNENKSPNIQF